MVRKTTVSRLDYLELRYRLSPRRREPRQAMAPEYFKSVKLSCHFLYNKVHMGTIAAQGQNVQIERRWIRQLQENHEWEEMGRSCQPDCRRFSGENRKLRSRVAYRDGRASRGCGESSGAS